MAFHPTFYSRFGKRWLDVVVATSLLVCLSPLLCLLHLFVKIKMRSPAIFVQERLGKDGIPFKLFKFCSMTNERDEAGELLPDSRRLTSFGRLLRSTSLDELPGFWNVLLGDMSLVGPRPLLVQYRRLYTPEQAKRHDVKPGITGWSQVNGRNALAWEDRFRQDQWYVQNLSLWLDIKILFFTLKVIVSRQGINAESHETMPKFTGSPENESQDHFDNQQRKAA
ncbi:MAG: sugar transferase [Planctomycetes bacterium]|nr:sugar transferase [Planctomycetota bacterium]